MYCPPAFNNSNMPVLKRISSSYQTVCFNNFNKFQHLNSYSNELQFWVFYCSPNISQICNWWPSWPQNTKPTRDKQFKLLEKQKQQNSQLLLLRATFVYFWRRKFFIHWHREWIFSHIFVMIGRRNIADIF